MALIIDHNYFRKDVVPGLTPEIAEESIYEYVEKKLGVTISSTTRMVTVERTTQLDERYLDCLLYTSCPQRWATTPPPFHWWRQRCRSFPRWCWHR